MKLFVSYRREGNVQRVMNLTSVLRENFGRDNIFLDTSSIEIGQSFPKTISRELSQATDVLAIISPEWLSSPDKNFRRRIDSPKDWVHIEIATALQKSITIVPVYVGGAGKLAQEQLPEQLQLLATLQGYDLRDDHQWNDDVTALISRLKGRNISIDEIRWPKNLPKYVPDAIGMIKVQHVMAILTEWELREFEVEDGPYKGQRGNEVKRIFRFQEFSDAINFMAEAKQGIDIVQHHPR